MPGSQNVPLFGHSHMGIDFSYIDGAVSQHFLDVADVNICFQKACGEGMAEHVRGNMQTDGSKGGIFSDHSADRLVGQRCAVLAGEEVSAALYFSYESIFVGFQGMGDRVASNLNFSFFRSLSVDQDGSVQETDICFLQKAEF